MNDVDALSTALLAKHTSDSAHSLMEAATERGDPKHEFLTWAALMWNKRADTDGLSLHEPDVKTLFCREHGITVEVVDVVRRRTAFPPLRKGVGANVALNSIAGYVSAELDNCSYLECFLKRRRVTATIKDTYVDLLRVVAR